MIKNVKSFDFGDRLVTTNLSQRARGVITDRKEWSLIENQLVWSVLGLTRLSVCKRIKFWMGAN